MRIKSHIKPFHAVQKEPKLYFQSTTKIRHDDKGIYHAIYLYITLMHPFCNLPVSVKICQAFYFYNETNMCVSKSAN